MNKNYPMFKVHIDPSLALSGLDEVFNSGFLNEGLQVGEFSNRLKNILQASQVVLLNSCTSAITLALRLSGVGLGDEVISTPMTCIATNTPIINMGADIVWADIDPQSGSILASDIQSKITPKTKAVICVDWAGTPVELEEVSDVCSRAGIPLIQDAAHAFGALYNGESIVHYADYTCLSFQAIKHLTCGDGGALIVRDTSKFKLAEKLKWFGYDRHAAKDREGNWKGQLSDVDIFEGEVGYKFNMNNISAAIGLSQLPHLEKILGGHRRNAAILDEALVGNKLITPQVRPKNSQSSFWVYTVTLDERLNRNLVLERLNNENIMAGLVHVPNDIHDCFKAFRADLPGVRQFDNTQVSLPCGWWLGPEDMEFIANTLIKICDS